MHIVHSEDPKQTPPQGQGTRTAHRCACDGHRALHGRLTECRDLLNRHGANVRRALIILTRRCRRVTGMRVTVAVSLLPPSHLVTGRGIDERALQGMPLLQWRCGGAAQAVEHVGALVAAWEAELS